MAIQGVGEGSLSGPLTASTPSASAQRDQFLKLLMAQLKSQNPLDPMKDADFSGQLAQFSMLEGIQQLNSSFQQLMSLQQLSQGANLIGKTVVFAELDSSTTGRGTVEAVSLRNGQLQVRVEGKEMLAERIRSVEQPRGS